MGTNPGRPESPRLPTYDELGLVLGRRPGSQTIFITSISSHGAKASGIAVDDEIVAVDDVDASDRSIKWVTDTMSGRAGSGSLCMVKMLRRSQHLPTSAPTLFTTPLRRQPPAKEPHEADAVAAMHQHLHTPALPSPTMAARMHTDMGSASPPTKPAGTPPLAPVAPSGTAWSNARTPSPEGESNRGVSQGAVLYSPNGKPVIGRMSPQKKRSSPSNRSPDIPSYTAVASPSPVHMALPPSVATFSVSSAISPATAAPSTLSVGAGVVSGSLRRWNASEDAAEATAALVKFCSNKHSEYDTERMHQAISFKEREGLTNSLLDMLRWLKASEGTLPSAEILGKMAEYEKLEAAAISRTFQAKIARARPEGEGGWQGCEVLGYMLFHHKRFIATSPGDIADALGASKASVQDCLGQMLKAGCVLVNDGHYFTSAILKLALNSWADVKLGVGSLDRMREIVMADPMLQGGGRTRKNSPTKSPAKGQSVEGDAQQPTVEAAASGLKPVSEDGEPSLQSNDQRKVPVFSKAKLRGEGEYTQLRVPTPRQPIKRADAGEEISTPNSDMGGTSTVSGGTPTTSEEGGTPTGDVRREAAAETRGSIGDASEGSSETEGAKASAPVCLSAEEIELEARRLREENAAVLAKLRARDASGWTARRKWSGDSSPVTDVGQSSPMSIESRSGSHKSSIDGGAQQPSAESGPSKQQPQSQSGDVLREWMMSKHQSQSREAAEKEAGGHPPPLEVGVKQQQHHHQHQQQMSSLEAAGGLRAWIMGLQGSQKEDKLEDTKARPLAGEQNVGMQRGVLPVASGTREEAGADGDGIDKPSRVSREVGKNEENSRETKGRLWSQEQERRRKELSEREQRLADLERRVREGSLDQVVQITATDSKQDSGALFKPGEGATHLVSFLNRRAASESHTPEKARGGAELAQIQKTLAFAAQPVAATSAADPNVPRGAHSYGRPPLHKSPVRDSIQRDKRAMGLGGIEREEARESSCAPEQAEVETQARLAVPITRYPGEEKAQTEPFSSSGRIEMQRLLFGQDEPPLADWRYPPPLAPIPSTSGRYMAEPEGFPATSDRLNVSSFAPLFPSRERFGAMKAAVPKTTHSATLVVPSGERGPRENKAKRSLVADFDEQSTQHKEVEKDELTSRKSTLGASLAPRTPRTPRGTGSDATTFREWLYSMPRGGERGNRDVQAPSSRMHSQEEGGHERKGDESTAGNVLVMPSRETAPVAEQAASAIRAPHTELLGGQGRASDSFAVRSLGGAGINSSNSSNSNSSVPLDGSYRYAGPASGYRSSLLSSAQTTGVSLSGEGTRMIRMLDARSGYKADSNSLGDAQNPRRFPEEAHHHRQFAGGEARSLDVDQALTPNGQRVHFADMDAATSYAYSQSPGHGEMRWSAGQDGRAVSGSSPGYTTVSARNAIGFGEGETGMI